jgi:hypothetical protein
MTEWVGEETTMKSLIGLILNLVLLVKVNADRPNIIYILADDLGNVNTNDIILNFLNDSKWVLSTYFFRVSHTTHTSEMIFGYTNVGLNNLQTQVRISFNVHN